MSGIITPRQALPAADSAVTPAPVTPVVTRVLLLSPLRAADGTWRVQRDNLPAGKVLAAYLPAREAMHQVAVNGAVILPKHYDAYIPAPDDEIWCYPAWGEPFLVGALVSIAVGLIVATASHFLFRPKPLLLPQQNTMTEAAERTFSFEGIRTAIGPGGNVPVIYGRHRVGGQLLRAAVDQAHVVIVDTSTAPVVHAITSVVTDFVSVVTVTVPNHSFTTGDSVLIENTTPTSVNGMWVVVVMDSNTLWLRNANHLTGNGNGGGGTAKRVNTGQNTYPALTNPPTLSLLLALGEGPIDAILTDTIQINGQPIGNFPGVQVYTGLGTANQPAIAEFGDARNTFSDGRAIEAAGLTYTTNAAASAFVLNLIFAQGLFYLNEKSEKESNVTTLQYRYAPTGTGAWSPWTEFSISADRTSTVRIGVRREGLTFQQYDIQVAFVRANQTDEVRAKYQATLESVTEFIPNTYAYPYTALLGLRSLASDALQGALPNITVEVRGRTVRVNTFNDIETWSDNPAWCIMDLLTNSRYGRGVPDSEINLAASSVYADYCTETEDGETRHTLNYVLDREQRAQAIFLETMGGSRGLLLKSSGMWTPRPTRNELPTCLLSWANSTNLKLTYLRDIDDINVMEARFANEEQDFEQDVLTWPPVEDWPADVHKQSLDLRGVTKPSRVMRALQFELNRRRYENLLLEMDCSAEALPVQIHDIFRFAHPLPGWGVSGRVQPGSTVAILNLDEAITLEAGVTYVVYVRHEDDTVDFRALVPVTLGTVRQAFVASPLSQTPVPRTSLWMFGRLDADANTRLFRVTSIQRKSDTTVSLQAIVHNGTIYDEPVGSPLPVITTLFNPFGPPPPLVSLIATEMTRIQPSGASLRVVNLSWDVAELASQYAPYGGAAIFRRTVLSSGLAGQAEAGAIDLGAILDPNDPNVNFLPLSQVRGHVLDYDDPTVITGGTYIYRVVPVSARGVPNNTGARDVLIHIAGPTTLDYYPGTPRNLRLRGQPVGAVFFEGRDIHLEWDDVGISRLFNETFFIQDYPIQVWAPGQEYLMRSTVVPVGPPGQPVQWTYTLQQNQEDQVRAGFAGARRAVLILVFARTNTGLLSLTPASLTVQNPPPDMSEILPDTVGLFEAALINWNQWIEPRDFDHYEVHLDTINPPIAIYQDVAIAFKKLFPGNLIAGTTYYVQILPYDTFGPGVPTAIASFTPVSMTADKLDTIPPATPTGLVLTTGTAIATDGTIQAWVQAAWNANTESDLAGYQVNFRVGVSTVPTVFRVGKEGFAPPRTSVRLENAPGQVTISAKLLAYDTFHNASAFTAEVSLVTAGDTTPPAAPTNLTAIGAVQRVHLLWTPPSDPDYAYSEVYAAATNNLNASQLVGSGEFSYEHSGLTANAIRFYWLRAFDRSGNPSAGFHPASFTAGVQGTAGQLDTTFISSLAANKILAGTITALVRIGVADRIELDGVNQFIGIRQESDGNYRVMMGKLGALSTDWGIRVFNNVGQVMFDAMDSGVTAVGIKAGSIAAGHLRTDTAVISVAAQIANALIGDAHITNLSANKILAGAIGVQLTLGVGSNIQLDGINTVMRILDANTVTRILFGKLGPLNEDYGLNMYNEAGDLMWAFNTGAQTIGIHDLAVTNAKILNLSASKITAGTVQAQVLIGTSANGAGSNIVMDGVNRLIAIYDENTVLRVLLGKIGPLNADYGMNMYNAAGGLMWAFNTGAQTVGIAPHAVTSSLLFSGSGGGLVAGTETEFGSVTFSTLNTGDQVWLVGKAWMEADDSHAPAIMHLREDSTSGTDLDEARHHAGSTEDVTGTMVVQSVYTAGSNLTNKKFLVSVTGPALSDPGTVAHVKLTGLRLQR